MEGKKMQNNENTLKIVGLYYALNPNYKESEDTEEVREQRVIEKLQELGQKKPRVVLMPDKNNPADPKAIMARIRGKQIGYVANNELALAHRMMKHAEKEMLNAVIVQVEVKKRGWFWVKVELSDDVMLGQKEYAATPISWDKWKCDIPSLEPDDAWLACREAEFVLNSLFADFHESDLPELMDYMKVWIDMNLHDLSVETKRMREHYINQLRATGHPKLEPLANRIDKQQTAVCGDHRMEYRLEWWRKRIDSQQVEHYWKAFQSRKGHNLWKALHEVDSYLRQMPENLYEYVGETAYLFSRLYYFDVPRQVLWDIYSLLLLRERICRELDMEMKPLAKDAYGVMDEPEETLSDQVLTDASLAGAVEACQSLFWAQSSWAVVYCVCRDYFGVSDNMREFEKRVQALSFSRPVYACPPGTIQKTISNNDFMRRTVDKWKEEGRAPKLARQLKTMLEQTF